MNAPRPNSAAVLVRDSTGEDFCVTFLSSDPAAVASAVRHARWWVRHVQALTRQGRYVDFRGGSPPRPGLARARYRRALRRSDSDPMKDPPSMKTLPPELSPNRICAAPDDITLGTFIRATMNGPAIAAIRARSSRPSEVRLSVLHPDGSPVSGALTLGEVRRLAALGEVIISIDDGGGGEFV